MNILEKIAEKTRIRINAEKEIFPLSKLRERSENTKTENFKNAFRINRTNIIAEIKFASPSEGIISNADPLSVAESYLNNGAAALSVLTEPYFFKGKLNYLEQIRKNFPQSYLLMKDFILEPYQIYQGKAKGANAVLLIIALLGEEKAGELYQIVKSLGMNALVEVHDYQEMKIAENIGAEIIGVNNRNLKNMTVDLKSSEELAEYAPKSSLLISESGIKSREDIERLLIKNYQGFLIGTSFMKSENPGLALAEMISHKVTE